MKLIKPRSYLARRLNPTTRWIWHRVREHKKHVVASLSFAFITALVQLQVPRIAGRFFDKALIPKDWTSVVALCPLLILVFFLGGVVDFLHRFFLRIAAERTVRGLRQDIFRKLMSLSQAQALRYDSGKVVNHIASDTLQVGMGLYVIADLFREPLMIIVFFGYLLSRSWQLTLVCLLALPVVALLGRALGRSAKRNQYRYQSSLDELSNHVLESTHGIRTAHAFAMTPQLDQEFARKNEKTYGHLIKLALVEELASPLTKVITTAVAAVLLAAASYFVIRTGQMTPGDLIAYITAAGMILQPLRQLNSVNVRFQRTVAAGERLRTVIEENLDSVGSAQAQLLLSGSLQTPYTLCSNIRATVLRFENVSFEYPSSDLQKGRVWGLKNISFDLPMGKKLALVGRSGSGKSTLSLLAMRFLDPQQGNVSLDGLDSREWDLASYRQQFSYVSQDVFLFDRTIEDNLRIAKPEATHEEIATALERAQVMDFVNTLPDGIATRLGERASTLSGGEKQRLAIARAFLKDTPFLVLDEATSQLDAHSEKAVQAALTELVRGRSVLLIAHRLSTVREADEILVMESGVIVERGNPKTLLTENDGHFTRLWMAQIDS